MIDAGPIRSERLELPLLSRAQMECLLAGDVASVADDLDARIPAAWNEQHRWLIQLRLDQLEARPGDAPWLLRAIVATDRADRRLVGGINFHGAPDEGGVPEVGYQLLPEERGRGYALEAVEALFEWARRSHGVRRFRASVAPDNGPSLRLIGKLGFRYVREQWDLDDGLELVFELDR